MRQPYQILECPECKSSVWMNTGCWYPQQVWCDECGWKGTEEQAETGRFFMPPTPDPDAPNAPSIKVAIPSFEVWESDYETALRRCCELRGIEYVTPDHPSRKPGSSPKPVLSFINNRIQLKGNKQSEDALL